MKTYSIVTYCGVHTQYTALSSFEACAMAREDGWKVMAVYPLIVKV